MKKYLRKTTALLLAVLVITAALAGCGNTNSSAEPDGSSAGEATNDNADVRVLQVRFDIAAAPMSYVDENGNATGMDVELLRIVDELLPDYAFNIEEIGRAHV